MILHVARDTIRVPWLNIATVAVVSLQEAVSPSSEVSEL